MKQITLLILLLTVSISYCKINIFTNKTQLQTGERLKITIETERPENSHPDHDMLKTDSDDFEFVDSRVIKQKKENGLIKETLSNEYTVFAEPGVHFFGPLKFSYLHENKEYKFKSDSVRIKVLSVLKNNFVTVSDSSGQKRKVPLDSLNTVLPVKDIENYELSLREKLYIAVFILLLVILIFLIVYLKKRKKKKNGELIEKVEKKIPAHLTAFDRLNELKNKRYIEKGEFKEFAAELSLIYRKFLEERFDFPAAELAGTELKEETRKFIPESDTLQRSDKLLEVTDFVKYARFIPLEAELKEFLEFAYKAVNELREPSAKEERGK